MSHIVLLGDSIFDNAAYVRGGPDVVTQLRELLPRGWQATLAAVDGAIRRVAAERCVPTIELRLVCTEPADYANPVEPSVRGGAKIARAIAASLGASGGR